MPKLTDEFFKELMAVYFLVFAAAVYFNWQFRNRLKKFHPNTWLELGEPTVFNNSISSGIKYFNFTVFQKRYEQLGDSTLTFYGRETRVGFIAIVLFMLAMLVLVLIAQHQNGVLNQPMVVTHPLNAAGGCLLGLIFGVFGAYSLLTKRLKDRHPQTWKELGEPTLVSNNTISNNWRMMVFVWSGRYRRLNDSRLNLYAIIQIGLTIIVFGIFILLQLGEIHT